MADELPEELVNKALTFAFGASEHPWYTAERDVRGAAVLFRVPSKLELAKCAEAAYIFTSPAAQEHEYQVQLLARAVVAVDGQDLPDELLWRVTHFHEMPDGYFARVYRECWSVLREYYALMEDASLKN